MLKFFLAANHRLLNQLLPPPKSKRSLRSAENQKNKKQGVGEVPQFISRMIALLIEIAGEQQPHRNNNIGHHPKIKRLIHYAVKFDGVAVKIFFHFSLNLLTKFSNLSRVGQCTTDQAMPIG